MKLNEIFEAKSLKKNKQQIFYLKLRANWDLVHANNRLLEASTLFYLYQSPREQ